MSLDNLMRLVEGAGALGVGLGLVTLPPLVMRKIRRVLRRPMIEVDGEMTADDLRELLKKWRAASPVSKAWTAALDDPPRPRCENCGSTATREALDEFGFVSCCPERMMVGTMTPADVAYFSSVAPRYYVRQMPGGGWHVVDRLAKLGVTVRAYARKWTAERGAARLNAKVGK